MGFLYLIFLVVIFIDNIVKFREVLFFNYDKRYYDFLFNCIYLYGNRVFIFL